MDDATVMRVRERVADLEQNFDAAFDAIDAAGGALMEPPFERDALDELHRE